MRMIAIAMLGAAGGGCTGGGTYLEGERYETGDLAFHRDPDWLGGDTAASVDLGDGRTLWLFGDTFIATSPARTRRESVIIHNSAAIMPGLSLARGPVTVAWQRTAVPQDLFPSGGTGWLNPLGGVMTPSGLILWFAEVTDYAPGGALFTTGTRTVRIADISGDPSTWTLEPLGFAPDWLTGCGTIVDDHLVAVAFDSDAGRLERWPLAAIDGAPEWWNGDGWVPEAELVAANSAPPVVFLRAAPQCTLVHDDFLYSFDTNSVGQWVFASQRGDDLEYRMADAIEGPYHKRGPAYTPSSSNGRIVHARMHTLTLDDGLSYAATWIDVGTADQLLDPATEHDLFWPHVARIQHFEAVE